MILEEFSTVNTQWYHCEWWTVRDRKRGGFRCISYKAMGLVILKTVTTVVTVVHVVSLTRGSTMSYKTAYLQSKGETFHIYNRGVNRGRIFFSDADYRLFLNRIPECLEGIGLVILSYSLMPSHYHFEARQDEPYAMGVFVKRVCDGYVKMVNFVQGRVGHLFQGRYQPKWVKSPAGIVYLSRYIHMNPVNAGLVKDPNDWEFSSCREYCGLTKPVFVDTTTILSKFDGNGGYHAFLKTDVPGDGDPLKGLMFRE
jgi:putative transposase